MKNNSVVVVREAQALRCVFGVLAKNSAIRLGCKIAAVPAKILTLLHYKHLILGGVLLLFLAANVAKLPGEDANVTDRISFEETKKNNECLYKNINMFLVYLVSQPLQKMTTRGQASTSTDIRIFKIHNILTIKYFLFSIKLSLYKFVILNNVKKSKYDGHKLNVSQTAVRRSTGEGSQLTTSPKHTYAYDGESNLASKTVTEAGKATNSAHCGRFAGRELVVQTNLHHFQARHHLADTKCQNLLQANSLICSPGCKALEQNSEVRHEASRFTSQVRTRYKTEKGNIFLISNNNFINENNFLELFEDLYGDYNSLTTIANESNGKYKAGSSINLFGTLTMFDSKKHEEIAKEINKTIKSKYNKQLKEYEAKNKEIERENKIKEKTGQPPTSLLPPLKEPTMVTEKDLIKPNIKVYVRILRGDRVLLEEMATITAPSQNNNSTVWKVPFTPPNTVNGTLTISVQPVLVTPSGLVPIGGLPDFTTITVLPPSDSNKK